MRLAGGNLDDIPNGRNISQPYPSADLMVHGLPGRLGDVKEHYRTTFLGSGL